MFTKILLLAHCVAMSTGLAQVIVPPSNKKPKINASYVIIEEGQGRVRFEERLQQKSDALLKDGYKLLLSDWKKIK